MRRRGKPQTELARLAALLGLSPGYQRAFRRFTLQEVRSTRRALVARRQEPKPSKATEELQQLAKRLRSAGKAFQRLSKVALVRLPIPRETVGQDIGAALAQVESALEALPRGRTRTELHTMQLGIAIWLAKLGVELSGTDEAPWVRYIVEASRLASGREPDARALQSRVRAEASVALRDLPTQVQIVGRKAGVVTPRTLEGSWSPLHRREQRGPSGTKKTRTKSTKATKA